MKQIIDKTWVAADSDWWHHMVHKFTIGTRAYLAGQCSAYWTFEIAYFCSIKAKKETTYTVNWSCFKNFHFQHGRSARFGGETQCSHSDVAFLPFLVCP